MSYVNLEWLIFDARIDRLVWLSEEIEVVQTPEIAAKIDFLIEKENLLNKLPL
jgi:hypothetical protein